MKRSSLALGLAALVSATALAQETQAPPAQQPPPDAQVVRREEVVVVSASKVESTLTNAPVTMSVVPADTVLNAASQNFGDVLRNVPGVNVIQMSARDVNLSTRQSTSTLATSQLVLLDGRSIYLDFFGLVLWDLVPNNPSEIKQIEVVRGPASAVWGANALSGVVNIITHAPREAQGFNLGLQGGIFDRSVGSRAGEGDGNVYGFNASWADAPSERFSYRISGGYFKSDPYSRPVGRVPIIADPRVANPVCNLNTGSGANCLGGASYPVDRATGTPGSFFANDGTSQPKVDIRLDQDFANGGRLTWAGGYAGSEGIVHTGIGPFRLQNDAYMAYGKVGYAKGALRINAFGNFLDAEAPNLLLIDPSTFRPVALNFTTQTWDFEVGHSTVLAGRHVLSYGGNARRNNFDITLAPGAEDRNEFGAYFQEEYFVDKFRLAVGARVDKFGNIDDAVFSPRVTVMFKPIKDHSVRLSFNKAFRSPSAINNYLSQKIFAPIAPIDLRPLRLLIPVLVPGPTGQFLASLVPTTPINLIVNNVGNPNLKEESLTAVYQNEQDDNINFTNITPSASFPSGVPPFDTYTAADSATCCAPTGIPGPLYSFLLQARIITPLPKTVSTYLNLGPTRQRGLEISLDHRFSDAVTATANYSFQDTPEIRAADAGQLRYPTEELAYPAKNRFNAAVNWTDKRFLGSVSVNFVDKALWVDVLTGPFHGFTESYTMVNANFGVRWAEGKVVTSIKATNLFNETIQQHVFGDILKRSITGEVRLKF
jgi:outer membrane receptor protein involved in Fe transport